MTSKKVVTAEQFKKGCLAMLDDVANDAAEIVITRHGKAVARLVPVADARERETIILARMRARLGGASVGLEADLLAPSSTLAPWKLLPKARRK
jgi:prevent-host-death family protein